MSEWIVKTIGEICDLGNGKVQTGPFGSQLHQSDYQEEGYPFVMPKDIINGKIDESSIARVSINHVERLSKHKLSLGDIIYGRRGDIGRQALVRQENVGWLCGSGCLRISLGDAPIDSTFLHLYLQLPEVMSWVENQAIGATMPNLNTAILRSVPVRYPESVYHQQQIVAIVSTYDDLIKNNDRRIALLEKMAEEIYREWFVRLRFPGWEQSTFHKGIPEGWIVRRVRELVEYYIGGGWGNETSSADFSVGAFVIRGTDFQSLNTGDYSRNIFRFHKSSNYKSRMIKAGDILFEVSGGSKDQLLGRSTLITEKILSLYKTNVICASFCKLIRVSKNLVSPCFMKYFFRLYYSSGLVGIYQVQSTGISNYQFEDFLSYQILITPPLTLINEFDKHISPLLDEKDILALANISLKQTRDRLLSRLISGKLSVTDLNIQFPPGMVEP